MRGLPGYEFYTGSKFALEGITDAMRYSLAPYNIFVTNVNPGPVKTEFANRMAIRGTVAVSNDPSRYISDFSDGVISRLNQYGHYPL